MDLEDATLYDFLSPPIGATLPSPTPRLTSLGKYVSLKIILNLSLFYLLVVNFYLLAF